MEHGNLPISEYQNSTVQVEKLASGCDDEMVKTVTGHSGVEMLKKNGE